MLTSVFYILDLHTLPNHLPDFSLSVALSHFLFFCNMSLSVYMPFLEIPLLTQTDDLINEPRLHCDGTVRC